MYILQKDNGNCNINEKHSQIKKSNCNINFKCKEPVVLICHSSDNPVANGDGWKISYECVTVLRLKKQKKYFCTLE